MNGLGNGCLVVSALIALAGCGEVSGAGGTDPSDPPTLDMSDPRVAEFAAMTDRLEDRSNTEFARVPTFGTATYTGFAGVLLNDPARPVTLIGDARIEMDFDADNITGELTSFRGEQAGAVGDYAGTVLLSAGDIAATRPNDFTFDYDGTLTGQGNTIVLDGNADGVFKGTRLNPANPPVYGILATSDPGDTALLNGTPTDVTVSISAEP